MKVIRAAALGFCLGVRRALQLAAQVPDPRGVTILGELVHNEEVLAGLARHGFAMRPESGRDDLPATPAVLITAHGLSDRERRRHEAAGKEVIDTTCPLVHRIHEAALDLQAQGYFVIVIGKRDHVEVRGITGDLTQFAVIGKAGEARPFPAERIGIVCQSTASPVVAQEIVAEIERHNVGKEVRFIPTICRPTLDRQVAMAELLGRVEAMVVVGGRHSNNTIELVKLSESQGIPCLHVQGSADVEPEWVRRFETIGLAAGTSTPDETIDAVERRLIEIGEAGLGEVERKIA